MIIPRTLIIMFALTSNAFPVHADGSTHDILAEDAIATRLLEWLRENGAYINEKLAVKHVVPSDPSSPRGIFATDDMDTNVTVCRIPWNLILKPSEEFQLNKEICAETLDCGTIKAAARALSGEEATPYGQYLASQPKDYSAGFWSKEALDLLADMLDTNKTNHMTEYDELPPHGVEDFVKEEMEEECGMDVNDPIYRHSTMLVKARADYSILVPFYDMMNHHNGRSNVKHFYDPYKDPIDKTGYELVTTEAIQAGEELYISYNHCNICYDRYDWFGTPEMFLHYGFVEPMPQRWLFDFARVKFNLDWKDGDESSGNLIVKFLVPPSKDGIALLQVELERLEKFATMYRNMNYEDDNILTSEWEALWQYYDALYNALSCAVQTNVELVDDVWKLGNNWWVKDGTLVATDQNEHWVLPTKKL